MLKLNDHSLHAFFSDSFSGAGKIFPVVKNQHLLLCTLLIGNSLAMEVLSAPIAGLNQLKWCLVPTMFWQLTTLIFSHPLPSSSSLQALPIFLDALVPPWAAILISVTLIVMFGEVHINEIINKSNSNFQVVRFLLHNFQVLPNILQILPQAVCTRYGLTVGATMAPLVRVLLLVFFPISYPISKVQLDCQSVVMYNITKNPKNVTYI